MTSPKERISALREEMSRAEISVYIVPTSDFHDSEYVCPYFEVRKFLSGFTGSAGTLVVSTSEAALFTDGRYFIQAENQLKDSGIALMKIGEPDVPTVREYVKKLLPDGKNIGFDGRVITAEAGKAYEKIASEKGGRVICNKDLADSIWTDRPTLEHTEIYVLDEKYSGKSTADKLADVRKKMSEKKADVHIITALDDISWMFNIRADDIECCPMVLSYAAITADRALLFIDESVCSDTVRDYLEKNGAEIHPYDEIYSYAEKLSGMKVLIDEKRVNYRLAGLLKDCETVSGQNPAQLLKAVKNPVEVENIRYAHLLDGIAVTKFMMWIKTHIGKEKITEWDAAVYMDGLRKEIGGEHFIAPSFDTISAYGANVAMMHYSAKKDDCAVLEPKGMLLVDSGGHYFEGTTDITRTFALGELTSEMRFHFTLSLRSMLNLAAAKFMEGCRGENLDVLARGPMWEHGLDYRCGTGHGVGYLLSVHESPNSFRWKLSDDRPQSAVLEEGMITTDEPGVYVEGSHGIRIENELLCRKSEKTEYGQTMEFETITYAPIDLDCIDVSLMEQKDRDRLNAYHKMVYEKLSPHFEGEELELLKKYTREI
ncbi:MAG: aminopeptidase P family protein [Oscillospiraceae bacterium]|nr:aminopeptidase P family protein [Oscillospiraceae bacterium]